MSLVAVGEPIRLTLTLDNVKESEVKVVFYRVDTGAEVGVVTRPLEGERLSVIWPAEGPNADTERSCEVSYRVVVGKLVNESSKTFVVFHDWAEVECVDASNASVPSVQIRLKRGKAEPQTIRTAGDGKGRVSVPNADPYDLDVIPPFRLVAWEGSKTGPKRKAKVEPCPFEVKFKWPVPGGDPHRQYVNHENWAAPQGCGSKIKLQIERKAGEINDTEFFIKAEFDGGNLERSDGKKYAEQPSSSPLKEESAGSAILGGKAKLKNNDAVAEIEVQLSTGGGDKVTIKIGDTKDCLNDTLVIESWRLINYSTPPDLDVPGNILQKVASIFAPAFIELKRKGNVKRQLNTACCHTIKGNYLSKYHRTMDQRNGDEDYLLVDFTPDNEDSDEYKALDYIAREYFGLAPPIPNIAVYLIDGCFIEQRCTTVVNFELKNKEATKTIEASKGYRFTEKRIANGKRFYEDPKCTIALKSGTFTPRFEATISDDALSVTFALAPEAKQPGAIGDEFGTIRSLRVQLEMYETKLLSGQAPASTCVFIQRRPHMENTYALTIAHELAHSIGAVAQKTTHDQFKGAEHPHFVLGRGFEGRHCTHGVAASDLNRVDNLYADLHDKNIRGDCVMWGAAPRGVAEDGGAPTTFCEPCLTSLKISGVK